MLIGVELIQYKKTLAEQNEKIKKYLEGLDRRDDVNFYDHLFLIKDLYASANEKLQDLNESVIYYNSLYDELGKIHSIIDKLIPLVNGFFSQDFMINEISRDEEEDDKFLVRIETYISDLNKLLEQLESKDDILDQLSDFSDEKERLNEKIAELENVFEGWKNRDLFTIFEDDSEKFKKIARKYEIAFYMALAFLFLYFFGWYVEIDTANFKFKFAEQFHGNHTATFYIQKISLLILSTTLAAFLLKRSFMNRRLADEAYRTAKELDALPRYMEGMPDEMKEKLRFDLAYKYFGNSIHHESYTGGENLMHENIKANTEFLKSVKDLSSGNAEEKENKNGG